MFAYCGNNPVMFTDVAGYAFFPCNICTKGSAAGAVEQYPQEEEPSFPGTVSMGGVVGAGIGPLSVSLQIALVTDSAGVSEIQISYSAPNIFSTGLPSVDEMFDDIKSSNPKFRFGATFAGSFTFTNAPSVDNLYGPTYSVGGAITGMAVDYNVIPIGNGSNEIYSGITITSGMITPGFNVSMSATEWGISVPFSVYDVAEAMNRGLQGG